MDRKRNRPGRELIGIALLALLLIAGLTSSATTVKRQEETAALLEAAAREGLRENWEEADAFRETARSRWEQDWKRIAVAGDHSPMEEIDALFSQLEVYAESREGMEFSAACRALATHIRAMGDAQRLSWWNLL